jgi:hypothetical protein
MPRTSATHRSRSVGARMQNAPNYSNLLSDATQSIGFSVQGQLPSMTPNSRSSSKSPWEKSQGALLGSNTERSAASKLKSMPELVVGSTGATLLSVGSTDAMSWPFCETSGKFVDALFPKDCLMQSMSMRRFSIVALVGAVKSGTRRFPGDAARNVSQ